MPTQLRELPGRARSSCGVDRSRGRGRSRRPQRRSSAASTCEGNQRVDAETIRAYLLDPAGPEFLRRGCRRIAEGAVRDRPLRRRADQPARRRAGRHGGREPDHQRGRLRGEQEATRTSSSRASSSRSRAASSRAPRCRTTSQRILELYRRSAAIRRRSRRRSIELPNNRVNLVFEITEGPEDRRLRHHLHRQPGVRRRAAAQRHRDAPQRHPRASCAATDNYDPDRLAVRRGEAAPLLPRPRLCRLPGHLVGRRSRPRAEHVLHHLHGR